MLAATAILAQDTTYPKAKVSFDDFKQLVAEVETHRASRTITAQFNALARPLMMTLNIPTYINLQCPVSELATIQTPSFPLSERGIQGVWRLT